MRVRLKGLNRTRKRLADGSTAVYHYAWKGGPRLPGKPGEPEFMAAYQAAVSTRRTPPQTVLFSLLQGYQVSENFGSLSERTRHDYIVHIKKIEKEFGDLPLKALDDKRTRGIFLNWRDHLAKTSKRQADYTMAVMSAAFSWAGDRGLIHRNPIERSGRLYRGSRRDNIWSETDEKTFLDRAPVHLHLPMLLALWTGQRQGDLLRLPWSAYDGKYIRLRQRKTGVQVEIPVGGPLKALLNRTKKTGPLILMTSEGQPWTSGGFQSSWRKACARAGIAQLTFHDLRGTAATRLALADCTVPQIAAITGHSLRDVGTILERHYLKRDRSMAEEAIAKLERRTSSPN